MNNQGLEKRIADEIRQFVGERKSLMLSTLDVDGEPYASYAPFAIKDEVIYVLLSEIAVHAVNLQVNPRAAVLLIEDEGQADELFARIRVSYRVEAQLIPCGSQEWEEGIEVLFQRHGERIRGLSQLSDFKLFRLKVQSGRYVKGFGKAYAFSGDSLTGTRIDHLREGHRRRGAA